MNNESISSIPAVHHFRHKRGDTFERELEFFTDKTEATPEDISGNTYKMDVVKCCGDVVLQFSIGDGFTIVPPNKLQMNKSAIEMKLAPADYKYDFQETKGDGTVTTRMAGNFTIEDDITQ